ncbi:hypothetical protein [Niastella sp. OAS944]|uniref:hypothetical protein n=1 Tax=Niastella sp. OAS944 TaxID=2664089 RepID=UPI003494E5BF|nr:hypothetical protein [Chitinophagaceae bacterium OAS944]
MKTIFLALPVVVSLLISCGKNKHTVAYNASFCKEHVVKIDDTLTLQSESTDRFAKLKLWSGEHTVSIDGGKPQTFDVDKNGILNIAKEEFVIFPIEFTIGKQHPLLGGTLGMPNWIIIDSFAVGNERFLGQRVDKTKRDRILKAGKGTEDSELQLTEKSQLYINEAWDIGVADETPETVKEKVSKNTRNVYRKKVLEAKTFLLYSITTGTYRVAALSSFPE